MATPSIYKEMSNTNPVTVIAVSNAINSWAASIPNHPYKNLSKEIDIKEIISLPTYIARVTTLYQSRRLYSTSEPYKHQNIPPLKYQDQSRIDIQSFNLPVSEIFAKNVRSYTIEGSQQVVQCPTCHGTGNTTCPQCNGKKEITCDTCGGSGRIRCNSCGGQGKHRCSVCNGTGYKEVPYTQEVFDTYKWVGDQSIPVYRKQTFYRRESCPSCNSKGYKECTSCNGKGAKTCPDCSGQGTVKCSKCSATGVVTCKTCNGNKQMLHKWNIEQTESPLSEGQYIINSKLAMVTKEYSSKVQQLKRKSIFSKSASKLTKEHLPQESFIETQINQLLSKSDSKNSANHKITKQKIEIESIDNLLVNYTFKGENYSLVIAGSEMMVMASKSPIAEFEKGILQQAARELRNGNETESYKLYKECRQIDSFDQREEVSQGIKKSFARITKYHKKGALLGVIISAIVFIPLLWHYYHNINKVFGYVKFMNDPGFFLNNHHPWAMLLFSLLFQYSAYQAGIQTMDSSEKFIKNRNTRTIVAMMATIMLAALLQATMIFLNATGFTLIFTFLVWIFTFWV